MLRITSFLIVLFLTAAAWGQNAQQLKNQFNDAYAKQEWARAVEAGTKLHAIEPQGGTIALFVACACANAGETKLGAEWLVTCAEAGYAGLTKFKTQPELDPLRAEPRYQDALRIIEATKQRQFDQFKSMAEKAKPIIILPPRYDKKKPTPLIIALHGSGGNGKQMADVWKPIAARAGAILVCPDALRPLGSGYQWTFIDEAQWLVVNTVERLSASHNIDPTRIILTGFSQGANVTLQVATTRPDLCRGVIPVCGHYESPIMPLPEKPGNASLPRFALLIGENDEAAQSNRDLEARLKALNIPTHLRIYKGAGHGFPPHRDRELTEALRFVLEEPATTAPKSP